jgi:hypothetical protein
MTKKTELEGVSGACKPREIADVIVAPTGNTVFGVELLARAIANTPTNELTIRGFA